MSSIPGYTLEMFLLWLWDITVDSKDEANFSVGMAEMLGTVKQRPVMSDVMFNIVVSMYEPYRETIEELLNDFDEETQSWRGYAEVVDMCVPEEVSNVVKSILSSTSSKGVEVEDTPQVPLFKHNALITQLEMSERTIKELSDKITLMRTHAKGNTWYWDPFDNNDLASIGCPIVIDADVFRKVLSEGC